MYTSEGKYNLLHFFFKYYPNENSVNRLLKMINLDLNHLDN